jgi:hypothetical protein
MTDILAIARQWAQPSSAEDAVSVNNLIQAYALFTDQGQRDDLASLFTHDATWDGSELGYDTATGPDAIVDVVLAHHNPDRPMVHLPGPPLVVRIDDDHLEVFSWTLATRLSDGLTKPLIFFSYQDRVRRGEDGWRFESRYLSLTFRATS